MIIDCISDLHSYYPQLEGGDLLIVAGDVTNNDREAPFALWIEEQPYEKIIWIAGNHDNIWYRSWLEHGEKRRPKMKEGKWKGPERDLKIEYLCDNGTIFKDLKIWGSPWTLAFEGMNALAKAFTVDTEEELADKFEKIPHNTDILITHSPPHGILDKTVDGRNVGSKYLYAWFKYIERPKLHVFGHIHEAYGQGEFFAGYNNNMVKSVNASHVNERYQPVNKPIRVIL